MEVLVCDKRSVFSRYSLRDLQVAAVRKSIVIKLLSRTFLHHRVHQSRKGSRVCRKRILNCLSNIWTPTQAQRTRGEHKHEKNIANIDRSRLSNHLVTFHGDLDLLTFDGLTLLKGSYCICC